MEMTYVWESFVWRVTVLSGLSQLHQVGPSRRPSPQPHTTSYARSATTTADQVPPIALQLSPAPAHTFRLNAPPSRPHGAARLKTCVNNPSTPLLVRRFTPTSLEERMM